MKSPWGSLFIFLSSYSGLFGIIHIEEQTNPPPCRPPQYTIYDMGATTVEPEHMSPYSLPHTYAPKINNRGQISANRIDEGYFRDLDHGELIPQIGYCLRGHAYGLNNVGDIIATLERNKENVDWFIWTQNNLHKEKRYPVETYNGIIGFNVDLRAINDNKWAVGSINPGCVYRPAVWNPRWGLKPLGFYLGWDFKGVAYGINQKGTIIGTVTESNESSPYAWNEHCGLEILRNYRTTFEAQSCHEIHGCVHFSDMVITDDNYVYGTLWTDNFYYHDDGKILYYAYRWEPFNQDFRVLNFRGMRINGVNKKHTLIGAIDGQAAVRERGEEPVLLKTFLKDGQWDLIEATDINDRGDIVGYGNFQGARHIFLMKKE